MMNTGNAGVMQQILKRLLAVASRLKTSTMWWMLFCVMSILYLLTCQRSVSWQDSGVFQWRILIGDYSSFEGLAVAHPFLILLGQVAKIIPVGDILWRMNAISGIGMAIAVANLMVLVALLTNRRWIGVLIATMFGGSHAVWWIATITETYGWVSADLTAELILLVYLLRRPRVSTLAGLAFLNGAGLCLHDFALLPLPVYSVTAVLLAWKKQIPGWSLALALLVYLAGSGAYLGLTAHLAITRNDLLYAVQSALFAGGYDRVVNTSLVTVYTKANAALGSLSFANVFLPLAIVGWFHFKRLLGGPLAWRLASITAIEFLFYIRYSSPDQFTFLPPTMVMVAIAAAVGAWQLSTLSARWGTTVAIGCLLSILAMPVLYGTLPQILRKSGIEVRRPRMLPYRDELRYWITPWKQNEDSAQFFAEAALSQALPDGVIISDMTPLYPLLVTRSLQSGYGTVSLQYDGQPLPAYKNRPSAFRQVLGGRVLYIVSPEEGYLDERFTDILRDGDVVRMPNDPMYRVVWRLPQ